MNKFTKAAVAGAAGIALLLGGAGSFALWNQTSSVSGGQITAGTLNMAPVAGTTKWTDITKSAAGTPIANIANFKIVPGNTITLQQDFSITGTGDDLVAQLTPTLNGFKTGTGNELAAALTQSGSTPTVKADLTVTNGTLIGTDTVKVTNGTLGATVRATITIKWPFGTKPASNTTEDNFYQGKSATLNDIALTLTQLDPASN